MPRPKTWKSLRKAIMLRIQLSSDEGSLCCASTFKPLIAPYRVHDDRAVQLGRHGAGEAGVSVSVPLHRGAHTVAVAQIDVVAHADLIAVINDGSAGKGEEQAIQQLDAAPAVIDQWGQPAPDADVDAHARIGAVGQVHVIALIITDHLQRQLVMIAQKQPPLAVVGNVGVCAMMSVMGRRSSCRNAMYILGMRGK